MSETHGAMVAKFLAAQDRVYPAALHEFHDGHGDAWTVELLVQG